MTNITSKDIVPLKKKVTTLADQATSFIIKNAKDMTLAVEILSNLNKMGDAIKEKKELLTKPLNLALKNAREMFKPLENPYEEAIEILRSKMLAYQTAKVKEEADEKARIASRVGDGKGKLKLETAVAQIEEVGTTDKNVSTEAGAVNFRTVKKFEIVDLKQVPLEYHLLNESLVSKVMKEGKELPGLRYFEEQVPVNYR